MDHNQHFEKYYSRLRLEGILKAFIWGLFVGFTAGFVTAFLMWTLPQISWGLWLALGVLVAVTAGATVAFYYTKFRPTIDRNARRLDAMGLEERLITMVEYEKDDSLIAQKQREDAKVTLSKVDVKEIKMRVSKLSIVLSSVFTGLGVAMMTVLVLVQSNILPYLPEIVEGILPQDPEVFYEVSYVVGEGGVLEGEEMQLVKAGEDGEPILVVADEGWGFMGWSDGGKNPYRQEKGVKGDIVLEAMFGMIDDGGQEGDGDQPGDKPENKPGDSQNPDPDADKKDPNAAGGRYDDQNQIIDGKTYYGDKYADAFSGMRDMLANNADLPADLKEMIQTYFDVIKTTDSEDNPWADPEGDN